VTNNAPDPITLLVQKFDQMNVSVCPKSKPDYEQVDNFGKKPTYSKTSSFQTTKLRLETKASTGGKGSDTLNPVGMVSTKGIQWCLPCNEAHSEEECPRRAKEEGTGSAHQMNFIDTIFACQDDEYVDITPEQLEEVRKRGSRKGRLRALNQLDENTKNKLRKKEILTYARRNRASAPVPPPQAKEDPPQLVKEVPLPPPPSMHNLLPKPVPTNEEI
jgi:hypothetical protein